MVPLPGRGSGALPDNPICVRLGALMRSFLPLLLLSSCSNIGSASIDQHGRLAAHNDVLFPVLSASKIIPAAMALERHDAALLPLIRLAVVNSDNAAADRLTAQLGGVPAVQRWMRSKGLRPYFTATEAQMVADPTAMTARPSELALTLYRIQSPELLALMAQTKTGNDRIRAAFPGAPHKSGTWGRDLVDIGTANGKIIAVMGTNATPGKLALAARESR